MVDLAKLEKQLNQMNELTYVATSDLKQSQTHLKQLSSDIEPVSTMNQQVFFYKQNLSESH